VADCNLLKFSLRERPVAREQRKLAAILAKDVVGGSAQAASSDKVEGIDWKRPDLSAN
jgi:hypothetical protein